MFEQPAFLALALLALALLWLAGRPRAPAPLATGTLALWRAAATPAAPRAPARRARRRPPPAAWLAAAAITAAALALAGPRPAALGAAPAWRLVVDASPSTALPVDGAAPAGPSRRARALEIAFGLVRGAGGGPIECATAFGERWSGGAGDLTAAQSWAAALAPQPEPEWTLADAPGTLFVTDRAVASARAGLAASGGASVPGPVDVLGGDLAVWAVWDGESVALVPGAAPARAYTVAGVEPEPFARALEAWAAARAIDGSAPPAAPAAVVLAIVGANADAAASDPLALGRDGWSTAARGQPLPTLEPGETVWLADATGRPWIAWRLGRIRSGISAATEPSGDPASFAVSCAELFDRALAPAPGVVALAERQGAGAEVARPPIARARPAARAGALLDASLALVAALLAITAALAASRAAVH